MPALGLVHGSFHQLQVRFDIITAAAVSLQQDVSHGDDVVKALLVPLEGSGSGSSRGGGAAASRLRTCLGVART